MARRLSVRAGLALLLDGDGGVSVAEEACIHVEEGVVASVESWATCPPGALGGGGVLALPQPANAHIHSADMAFPEFGVELRLEEAVAPPGGLKHRLLEAAPREALVRGILQAYTEAWETGTGLLVDFREGGGVGCGLALEAASRLPQGMEVLVLGRPGPGWRGPCQGLGVSSPLDYPVGVLARLAGEARPAMAHVAETPRARLEGDLEAALEAGLDAVVHGVFLGDGDLEAMAERGVGLVACVRSNMWHSLGLPPLAAAARAGVELALGSDNAAWMTPDPWEEARAALYAARLQGLRREGARLVARALFVGGYRVAGREPRGPGEGREAYMVIARAPRGVMEARDKLYAVLKRIGRGDVMARVDRGVVTWL